MGGVRSGRGAPILPLGSRVGRKRTLWARGGGRSLREDGLAGALRDPWGEGGRRRLEDAARGRRESGAGWTFPPRPPAPRVLIPEQWPLVFQGLGEGSCRRRGGGARREGSPSSVSATPTPLLARGVGRPAPRLRGGGVPRQKELVPLRRGVREPRGGDFWIRGRGRLRWTAGRGRGPGGRRTVAGTAGARGHGAGPRDCRRAGRSPRGWRGGGPGEAPTPAGR